MAKGPFYTPGDYMCEITSQEIGEAKTGTPQIILGFKVLGYAGEAGELEEVSEQYTRTMWLAVTEARMPYLVEELKGFGYNSRELSPLDPEHPKHVSLVGRTVRCQCDHDYDQRQNLREKWQPSRGRSKPKPVARGKMAGLDKLYAGAAASQQGSASFAAVVASTEITDDDIPF